MNQSSSKGTRKIDKRTVDNKGKVLWKSRDEVWRGVFFSSEATKEKEKEIAIEVRSQEVKITPVEEEEEAAEE
ncbi:hypothetical protein RUM44_009688 [Polyplax serrata]|uniref:Uncharacterized protein n=1 Tax=Polyplax serrata TaxID=468196 RepID=A0ABR1ATE5_POLSC